MRALKNNFSDFRDVFIEELFKKLTEKLNHDSISVTSQSADVVIYQELMNTLPESSYTFPLPYLDSYCLLIFDTKLCNLSKEKEEAFKLQGSIVHALEYFLNQERNLNIKLTMKIVELVPFFQNYFLDLDKIIYVHFEVVIEGKATPFALVFSVDHFNYIFNESSPNKN
jgi:hypothetical protein